MGKKYRSIKVFWLSWGNLCVHYASNRPATRNPGNKKSARRKGNTLSGTKQAAFVGATIVGNFAVQYRHSQATAKAACFVTYTI